MAIDGVIDFGFSFILILQDEWKLTKLFFLPNSADSSTSPGAIST